MQALARRWRAITRDEPGDVIAEIGHNHQGELEKAKALSTPCRECGDRRRQVPEARQSSRSSPARSMRAIRQREQLRADLRRAPRGARAPAGRAGSSSNRTRARGRRDRLFCNAVRLSRAPRCSKRSASRLLQSRLGGPDQHAVAEHIARYGEPMGLISTGGATIEDVDRAVNAVAGDQLGALRDAVHGGRIQPTTWSWTWA